MLYVSYLLELATQYRELGEKQIERTMSDTKSVPKIDPATARKAAEEYLELADICARVAADLEDHATAG